MMRFKICLLTLVVMPVSLFAVPEKMGNLAAVRGVVLLNGKPAKNGAILMSDSKVTTKDGGCTLLIGTANVIHLDKNSQIDMTEYSKTGNKENIGVNLKFGRLRALAASKKDSDKSFNIKTRTAVMGIRGTHVYVDAPRDINVPVNFLTIEGTAVVTLNNPPAQSPGSEGGQKKGDSGSTQGESPAGGDGGSKSSSGSKGDGKEGSGDKKSAQGDTEKGEKSDSKGSSNEGEKGGGSGKPGPNGGTGPGAQGENSGGKPGGMGGPPTMGGGPDKAPPMGPATITLGANQMVSDNGGTRDLDPGAALQIAHEVAPPPPTMRTGQDVDHQQENRPPPPGPGTGPGTGGFLPPPDSLAPPPPPIYQPDPIADGQRLVPVTVTFTP